MILLVGGRGQGKLAYAMERKHVGDAAVARTPEEGARCPIFAGLEGWLKTANHPWPALEALLEANPDVVILCDEVGCGVVPMDRSEREWRERVGRVCCGLARRAGRVERLCCGIPTVLKGEEAWN